MGEDVQRLRRLLRDSFSELLLVRGRLRALEEHTGLARAFHFGGAAKAAAPQRPPGQWSARVSGDGAAPPLLELCCEAHAPQHSLSLRLGAPLEAGGGALRLTRAVLRTRLSARARLLLVGAGCDGGDGGPTLNPAHGVARGALGRGGAAPYRQSAEGGGAAAALLLDAPGGLSLSAALFAPDRQLLQATWRPAPRLALAAAAVRGGGAASASLAACAALGQAATLAGWLAAARAGGAAEWALCLAPPPPAASPAAAGWGLVLGRPLGARPQLEAFLALGARGGDGWSAQPGLTLQAGAAPTLHARVAYRASL